MDARLALLIEAVYNDKEKIQKFRDALVMIGFDYGMSKREVAKDRELLTIALREAVAQ